MYVHVILLEVLPFLELVWGAFAVLQYKCLWLGAASRQFPEWPFYCTYRNSERAIKLIQETLVCIYVPCPHLLNLFLGLVSRFVRARRSGRRNWLGFWSCLSFSSFSATWANCSWTCSTLATGIYSGSVKRRIWISYPHHGWLYWLHSTTCSWSWMPPPTWCWYARPELSSGPSSLPCWGCGLPHRTVHQLSDELTSPKPSGLI